MGLVMRVLQLLVQARDYDWFDLGRSSGYGEKPVLLGYKLKGEPTGFPDKLDLGCKKKKVYQQ